MKKFRQTPGGRTSFTSEDDEIILAQYLELPIKTLARKLGRSHVGVRIRLRQLGLIIPPELARQRTIDSRIKLGNIPYLKGKKLSDVMTPEQIARSAATRFKKGSVPHNTGADGNISVRYCRKRNVYSAWIRLEKNRWKQLHHFNYEKVHGPVPKGYCVSFKDFNPLNCDIGNLELITREQNLSRIRKLYAERLPEELRVIIDLRKELITIIKTIRDERHNEHRA